METLHMPHDKQRHSWLAPSSLQSSSGGTISRHRRTLLLAAAATPALAVPALSFAQAASAPTKLNVVIGGSTGFGISYLPLTLMVENKLLEKHAAALGVEVTSEWRRFPTAIGMHEALLSGSLDFGSGGVSQLLTSWDKTRMSLNKIKGVSALNSMPIYLVSSNPQVKTVADISSQDRIALPTVRTSIQAVVLAMAAEKAFGDGQAARFEPMTVSMGHPAAMAALLSGNSDLNGHFASAPFMYEELAKPGIRKVVDSYDVLGGAHTFNAVWSNSRFKDANPKVITAFLGALQEALNQIKADPAAASVFFLKSENVKNMSAAQIEDIIRKPENEWTVTPKKVMSFASFMNKTALVPSKPAGWQELFFDNIHNLSGS
jgi:NitT/TauT family transport system substrate-binding protein